MITAVTGGSPAGLSPSSALSVSDQSYATMSSRVSQIEEKLNTMEVNITSVMEKSIASMLEALMNKNTKPVGGKSDKEN